MALLGELGCFAYYFNSIAWFAASGAVRFSQDSLMSAVLLILTCVLATLAYRLLIKAIEIHFSDQTSREILLPEASNQRKTALSLPFLLRRCLPDNCLGNTAYLLFLVAVLIALLRTCITPGFKYYKTLINHANLEDYFAPENWAVAVLIVAIVSLPAFFTYQSLQIVQVVCIFLNILSAFSKVTDQEYVETRKTSKTELVFPRFMTFLSMELIIPSVIAVSKVSFERHKALLTAAVGLVAGFYVLLAWMLQSGSQIDVEAPEWTRDAIALPCLFASFHICMGALMDVVIAWRYDLNIMVAQQLYPHRIQAVRLLLPLSFAAFCFFCMACKIPFEDIRGHWVLGSLLTASVVMFIIPYCHKATYDRFAGKDAGDDQKWGRYVLYAGGVGSLAATLYFSCDLDFFSIASSMGLDACVICVLLLWEVVGRYC